MESLRDSRNRLKCNAVVVGSAGGRTIESCDLARYACSFDLRTCCFASCSFEQMSSTVGLWRHAARRPCFPLYPGIPSRRIARKTPSRPLRASALDVTD